MAIEQLKPKEKAKDLYTKFFATYSNNQMTNKRMALEMAHQCVDEIILELKRLFGYNIDDKGHPYWEEVKAELNNI
jgi:hypothetical protein